MTVEERAAWAAEQIAGDASLTGELQDAEAMRLIEWSVAVARRLAEQTGGMDDTAASAALENALPNLRKVVRRANKLIGGLPTSVPEMTAAQVAEILEAAVALPGLAVTVPDSTMLAARLAGLQEGDALTVILAALNGEVI